MTNSVMSEFEQHELESTVNDHMRRAQTEIREAIKTEVRAEMITEVVRAIQKWNRDYNN